MHRNMAGHGISPNGMGIQTAVMEQVLSTIALIENAVRIVNQL